MLPVEKTYENGMAIMNENEGSSDVVSEQYWPWPETVTRYHGTSYKFFFFFFKSLCLSLYLCLYLERKKRSEIQSFILQTKSDPTTTSPRHHIRCWFRGSISKRDSDSAAVCFGNEEPRPVREDVLEPNDACKIRVSEQRNQNKQIFSRQYRRKTVT